MGGETVDPPILGQQEAALLHHYLRRPFRVHPGSRLLGEHNLIFRVSYLNPPVSRGMMVLMDLRAELNV